MSVTFIDLWRKILTVFLNHYEAKKHPLILSFFDFWLSMGRQVNKKMRHDIL
jgi:hypothetical protein